MKGDDEAFLELSDRLEAREPINLRDLVKPVPLDRADSARAKSSRPRASIARFATAAMSLGALAPEVHKTIAIARQPARRAQQLRRRRRGARALRAHAGFRPQRDQASRLGALRRRRDLSGERRRDRDQDGAGLEARRRRADSRLQGLAPKSPRCAAPSPGQGADLAAAASRHLLDRRPRRTDLRSAPRRAASAHRGQARQPSRHRLRRQRRRESATPT